MLTHLSELSKNPEVVCFIEKSKNIELSLGLCYRSFPWFTFHFCTTTTPAAQGVLFWNKHLCFTVPHGLTLEPNHCKREWLAKDMVPSCPPSVFNPASFPCASAHVSLQEVSSGSKSGKRLTQKYRGIWAPLDTHCGGWGAQELMQKLAFGCPPAGDRELRAAVLQPETWLWSYVATVKHLHLVILTQQNGSLGRCTRQWHLGQPQVSNKPSRNQRQSQYSATFPLSPSRSPIYLGSWSHCSCTKRSQTHGMLLQNKHTHTN